MDVVSELWGSMAITGKVVVTALALMSIYSYAVMVDRFLALRWARERSSQFGTEAEEGGLTGNIDALLAKSSQAEEQGHCALGSVVSSGLREYKTLVEEGQPEAVVVEGVDEAVSRALDVAVINLRQRLTGMATISGVGPFLGLFGTVTGLISAFRGIAETGSGGIATVSGGISEALVTTVIGLFVAIPALWAYNYFMSKIDVMTIELDNAGSRIVSHVVRRALASRAA